MSDEANVVESDMNHELLADLVRVFNEHKLCVDYLDIRGVLKNDDVYATADFRIKADMNNRYPMRSDVHLDPKPSVAGKCGCDLCEVRMEE